MIKKSAFEIKADRQRQKWTREYKRRKKPKKKPKKIYWFDEEIKLLRKKSYIAFLRSKYWKWIKEKVLIRD